MRRRRAEAGIRSGQFGSFDSSAIRGRELICGGSSLPLSKALSSIKRASASADALCSGLKGRIPSKGMKRESPMHRLGDRHSPGRASARGSDDLRIAIPERLKREGFAKSGELEKCLSKH